MSYQIGKDNLAIIDKILQSEGYRKVELGKHGYRYNCPQGGQINAFKTGTITIQGNKKESEENESLFLEKCGHLILDDAQNNLQLSFKVPIDKIMYIQQIIDRFIAANLCESTSSSDNKVHYRYRIVDKNGNEITVTQFKNNSLLIQGSRSSLWENLTENIGTELNLNFKTIFAKIVVEPGKPIEVVSVVTADAQDKAIRVVKQRLGDCYMFLYEHDRNLIEASQCLIDSGISLNDYYGCVSGTIKSVEGFIKNILIKINAFKESEVRSSDFNFKLVIDLRLNQLTPNVANCLPREKHQILFDLIKIGIYDSRHPNIHDNPPPIRQFKDLNMAESLHSMLLGLMNKTHNLLKPELEK